MLLGVAAAFTFVLSALKMPSVTGSCSHPTGTGLGAVLFGPAAMAPIGMVVLLFQAILLAHGGLTTLGANIFSMAIVGPFAAAAIYRLAKTVNLPFGRFDLPRRIAGGPADLRHHIGPTGAGLSRSGRRVCRILCQVRHGLCRNPDPAGHQRRALTVVVFNALARFNPQELKEMNVVTAQEVQA